MTRTDNHNVEVEAFADALAVPLVGQVCESNVACKLPAHNVHVVGHGSCGLGVLCGDRLRSLILSISHGYGLVHGVWAVGRRGRRWGRTRWRYGRFCNIMLAPVLVDGRSIARAAATTIGVGAALSRDVCIDAACRFRFGEPGGLTSSVRQLTSRRMRSREGGELLTHDVDGTTNADEEPFSERLLYDERKVSGEIAKAMALAGGRCQTNIWKRDASQNLEKYGETRRRGERRTSQQ